MSEDWSLTEVELIVEDYLTMLSMELRGELFNKAERNRDLQKLLPTRSRGSIEFKHQNISAVMIEMGYPYVEGYKPRSNYQSLLQEVVESRIYSKPELVTHVAELVEQTVSKPVTVADLLSIQVAPPVAPTRSEIIYEQGTRRRAVPRKNYLEQEARNRSVGRAGEELVIEFEQQRLWRAGQKALARRIEHVAAKDDGCGFDVLSFEADGRERLVEVKTTRFGVLTPFFASRNEVAVSEERSAEYHVYRLFDFSKSPRLFMLAGSMQTTCRLEPVTFRAQPAASDS